MSAEDFDTKNAESDVSPEASPKASPDTSQDATSEGAATDSLAEETPPSEDASTGSIWNTGDNDSIWDMPTSAVAVESAASDSTGAEAEVQVSLQTPAAIATQDDAEDEDAEDDEETAVSMSLREHLHELRVRITRCFIGIFVGFIACYGISDKLFAALRAPAAAVLPEGSKFIYTGMAEAFFTEMKIAFVAGIFLMSPYIFYQIWAFIAPGLHKEERRYAIPMALFSAFFFVSGAAFCYFIVFPFAFTFFMGYNTEAVAAMPSLREYLGFSLKLLFAFGLIFEMPLFVFFLARLGLVTAAMMRKFRKYAVVGNFVVAAILTPPDVISQTCMAVPLLLLYELSVYVALVFGRDSKKQDETKEAEAESV